MESRSGGFRNEVTEVFSCFFHFLDFGQDMVEVGF